jgi:class II lanthipeptide synthase
LPRLLLLEPNLGHARPASGVGTVEFAPDCKRGARSKRSTREDDVSIVNRAVQLEYETANWIERLILRAATFDELLSDEFESLPGQKGDADLAARRLAAWCRASASGDWSQFAGRLERDGLSLADVLARFATARCRTSAARPDWVGDAVWIVAAIEERAVARSTATSGSPAPYAFEDLLIGAVEKAQMLLWAGLDKRACAGLTESASLDLREGLLRELSELCAPALYERFSGERKKTAQTAVGEDSRYPAFLAGMRAGGLRRLFDDKPVLLRLIAIVTRQWLEASRELVSRLDRDRGLLERHLLGGVAAGGVVRIEGDLSDPHNGGRSVKVLTFESGARAVYKPKDLRLDVAWHGLIARLNEARPPIDLRAVRTVARDGYGWTEYIAHTGCNDWDSCRRFFTRSGAWLALFHCVAATDMHHENMIAAGDQPVPIDLEMVLQASVEEHKTENPEALAFEAVLEQLGNSVLMVGLLPSYMRSPENEVLAAGGLISRWTPTQRRVGWKDPNSDAMRPIRGAQASAITTNLPHVEGRYAKLSAHIDDFVRGFEDYATFLLERIAGDDTGAGGLLDGFDDVLIRKVLHPTRFYYLLLQRLRNYRSMDDGILWSVQADFLARLTNWDRDIDPLWAVQRAERSALLALNVPYFVSPGDGNEIRDSTGILVTTTAVPGINRARARIGSLDRHDITWQTEIIRESTAYASRSGGTEVSAASQWAVETQGQPPGRDLWAREADEIVGELVDVAIRRGPAAAWIGLDWLGDSDISQFVLLGPELYNGVSGIGVFLAAHAAVTRSQLSAELALSGVAHLRNNIRSRNAARFARSLGVGVVTGMASVVYGLTVMSRCLCDGSLLEDAHRAAELFTDDLIAADTVLDVVAGSAGAILGLLRLHRDTASEEALRRATRCGEHLLAQRRVGPEGARMWCVPGFPRALTGMSHGAAGFAYALMSLSEATGREDFAAAASECLAFENATYDPERMNWPDLRDQGEPRWACQWCHGAAGIGLARAAMIKRGASAPGGLDPTSIATDVENAVGGVERGWPGRLDTLCCGTLSGIELLREADAALQRGDLRTVATRRLKTVVAAANCGDYRWNGGSRRFNLGLFRGLAGVGYTLLREIDASLPNVLIWE